MGKEWDSPDKMGVDDTGARGDRDKFVKFLRGIMAEALRVLKPGGHAFVWALPRTSHWTALALEDAGFEVRDCVYHVFGCLSEDTEILTEAGWTKYTALKVGQLALCYDKERGNFRWEPIEEVFVYPYAETAYRIHGASTDHIVSKNHRCPVIREGKLSFEPAETLKGDERVPVPSVLELGCIVDTLTPGDKIYRKPMVGDVVDMLLLLATPVKVEPVPYEGIVWCVRVPTGAFVARRAGKAFVTGNSGFPKSRDPLRTDITPKVEQQLREQGVTGEIKWGQPSTEAAGLTTTYSITLSEKTYEVVQHDDGTFEMPEELQRWRGWGSALKPAVECWWLCRKPLSESTVAAQVLSTGTGAINVDVTRVKHASPEDLAKHQAGVTALKEKGGTMKDSWKNSSDLSGANDVKTEGRWPANFVIHHSPCCKQVDIKTVPAPVINRFTDGMKPFGEGAGHPYTSSGGGEEEQPVYECVDWCPARAMDEQSGETTSGAMKHEVPGYAGESATPFLRGKSGPGNQHGGTGGASRFFQTFEPEVPFFYTAKAARSEKEDGLEEFGKDERFNCHPTVKSLALMRYLIKMVTPKGGTVLDPFAGSGSTLVAAIHEGMHFVGIEREDEYIKIARKRVGKTSKTEVPKQVEKSLFDAMLSGAYEDE